MPGPEMYPQAYAAAQIAAGRKNGKAEHSNGCLRFALMLRQEIFVWESFVESKHLRWTSAIFPHIAIIMDGNGRWAKKGDARKAGHAAGAETFRKIGNLCKGDRGWNT